MQPLTRELLKGRDFHKKTIVSLSSLPSYNSHKNPLDMILEWYHMFLLEISVSAKTTKGVSFMKDCTVSDHWEFSRGPSRSLGGRFHKEALTVNMPMVLPTVFQPENP